MGQSVYPGAGVAIPPQPDATARRDAVPGSLASEGAFPMVQETSDENGGPVSSHGAGEPPARESGRPADAGPPRSTKRKRVIAWLTVCVLFAVTGWLVWRSPFAREMGVRVAGEFGSPAIPLLRRATADEDYDVRRAAGEALAGLGRAAVPPLVASLRDEDPAVRTQSARAISYLREQAESAVPDLIEAMSDREIDVRRAAILALTAVAPTSDEVLPVFVKALKDEDAAVRAKAAEDLGRFGLRAKSALPALRDLLQDPDAGVRDAVQEALERIDRREDAPAKVGAMP